MNKKLDSHDSVLEAMADEIDISVSLKEKAIERFESIDGHLRRSGSILSGRDPEVYIQGSFLLGTVIRPIGDADEFDLDLVCRVDGTQEDHTQEDVKLDVGDEVKTYIVANGISKPAKNGRRCWTIEYASGEKFHIDILPALPNARRYQEFLESRGHIELSQDTDAVSTALAITDKEHPRYAQISDDWLISNPLGYAAWFRSRQSEEFERQKISMVEQRIFEAVEEVPDFRVKTPLQRSIQLLKRHRDSLYADDDDKPISVIISTLAAKAYQGEQSLTDALRTLLKGMKGQIDDRGDERWVPNPVNPEENFADKWAEHPRREQVFYEWLQVAQRDFSHYLRVPYSSVPEQLVERIGSSAIDKIAPMIALAAATVASPKDVASREVEHVKDFGGTSKPWVN
ncbi:MAG: nucleotidyltransferase [Pseudomonadota bacterium]